MAFKTPITIREAVEAIHRRTYVLPAIQREFLWTTDQIAKLFDSLMRGYPIGSFLFWRVDAESCGKYQFYNFLANYHERDETHNRPAGLSLLHNGHPVSLGGLLEPVSPRPHFPKSPF